MTKYRNGFVPRSALVKLADGRDSNGYWEFLASPGLAARWAAAKKEAERRFGKTIYISTGWNMYRPYAVQVEARDRACRQGNCFGAASPGSSSHGGTYRGRDALAIDVNPNGLSWAQVWEACRAVGFVCGAITAQVSGIPGGEPWHIIDYDPWRAVPASAGESEPLPEATRKDTTMRTIFVTDKPNRDNNDGPIENRRRYSVGEFSFQPLSLSAAKLEWEMWGLPENLTRAQARQELGIVQSRRASGGMEPLPLLPTQV